MSKFDNISESLDLEEPTTPEPVQDTRPLVEQVFDKNIPLEVREKLFEGWWKS